MRILQYAAASGGRAKALAILLPGALQQPEDLVRAGFVDTVRERRLSLDLWLPDLGIAYIGETTDGTALARLHAQVIRPARQHYAEIWLAGISIGGFMAIAHADRYPGEVDGLCLLAPYPGNRIITREIEAAGGIGQWLHDAVPEDDAERRMWRWLKTHRALARPPLVRLGYGREDRFAAGHRLMAAALPACDTGSVAGGHDWPAWQQLWKNFLDREALRFLHDATEEIE